MEGGGGQDERRTAGRQSGELTATCAGAASSIGRRSSGAEQSGSVTPRGCWWSVTLNGDGSASEVGGVTGTLLVGVGLFRHGW